jgi:streptogramin lyase
VLLALVLGLVLPGSAAAFEQLSSFGEFGSGAGQLRLPAQIAVGPDGDVYVADAGNDRIEVYTGSGMFLRALGAGLLDEPGDVALDDDGRVFVADSGNHRVAAFSSGGSFLYAFGESGEGALTDPVGLDVDASMFGGTVYVADSGNDLIAAFSPGGTFLESFGSVSSPRDVVVGSGGNLVIADFGNERIAVIDKEGDPVRFFGEGGEGELAGPVAIAVDQSGAVYVADQLAQRVVHFTADGAFIGAFNASPAVSGVAAACRGNVFAVEHSASTARVARFGEAGTPPPPCQPEPEPIVDLGTKLPSNRFHFAGLRKNRANGFAVLFVRVPGPGKVSLSGRGFRRLSRTARQATTVSLPIKPKVRLRIFLRQHGKGRIRVEVTFTPSDGEPRMREKVIVLRRHRG